MTSDKGAEGAPAPPIIAGGHETPVGQKKDTMTNNEKEHTTETSRFRALANFSVIMIIISGVVVSLLMNRAITRFSSIDKIPEIHSLVPQAMEKFGSQPGVVRVGLYIKDFSEFDMLKNSFEFSGIIWFLFDPSIISLDTLGKFSFEKGKIVSLSAPSTKIVEGKLLARYNIRVNIKTNLSYALFPFDSHTLFITLDNNYVTPGEVLFESSFHEVVISPEIAVTDWKVSAVRVYSGYSSAILDKQDKAHVVAHPRIIFAIDYGHAGIRQALTIILPLILVFFMSLFSFALDPKNYASIITLSSGAVTALLAYRFVIENLSPKVGYFMVSDYVFFLVLSAAFIVFFINIGLVNISTAYKKVFIVLFQLIFVVSMFYLMRV